MSRAAPAQNVWSIDRWQSLRHAHAERVAACADAFVQRRSRQEKHPVDDFLFTYYSFSPAKLKQWVPPLGIRLEMEKTGWQECEWPASTRVIWQNGFLCLDETALTPHLRDLAGWVAALCDNILERPARYRCYGLHEWAMVYRQSREQIRHQGYELRLPPEVLAQFVESQSIGCSHYDAFRFFTPEARPMNALQPTLDSRLEMEQGGCLHANMDLYKWAAKLWPWTGSDLVGRTFALAREGRDLDMRASPYDLRHLGYIPVAIETPEGRRQYEEEQRHLAEKAAGLRTELASMARRISQGA